MAEPNTLKLAKQGNPKAIAAMINRSLRAKHIIAQVNRKDDCLQVFVESAQVPNQKAMVSFIRQGLTKLGVETIKTVQVYGRQKGQDSFAWNQSFDIESSPPQVADVHHSDPDFNLHQTPEDVAVENDISSDVDDIKPSVSEPPPGSNFAQVPRHVAGGYTSSKTQQPRDHASHRSTHSIRSQPRQPMKPLSVGNIIRAGLRVYLDHFQVYYLIALKGYPWIIIPIYGWAKFSAMTGLLSRLAFHEIIERPETVTQARRYINPRMWSFLGVSVLVFLIVLGRTVLGACILFLIFLILTCVLGELGILVGVLLGLVFPVAYIWLSVRLSITEMPIAIEDNVNAGSSIGRSCQLTQGYVGRIILICFVAFLLFIPLYLGVGMIRLLLEWTLGNILPEFLYTIVVLGLNLASSALFLPLGQTIKAAMYYDIRSRREGMGLQLNSHHQSR
ncbi:hypothetical protein [Coleofasciculus chthonoplastes]|uniref:hypothetical protein n=1 Tax=Coleofasciculus chthonoplastes TaxID=64178 RepID=UPI0033031C0B